MEDTQQSEDTQELLETILKAIVSSPDQIKIKKEVDEMGVLYRIWVAKEDMGLVIGKVGATANALKLIIKIAGYKIKSRVAIKIEEPAK